MLSASPQVAQFRFCVLPIDEPDRREGLKLVSYMLSQSQQIWNGGRGVRLWKAVNSFEAAAFAKSARIA